MIGAIMVTVLLLVEEVIKKDTELVTTLHQPMVELIAMELTMKKSHAMITTAQVKTM